MYVQLRPDGGMSALGGSLIESWLGLCPCGIGHIYSCGHQQLCGAGLKIKPTITQFPRRLNKERAEVRQS